MKEGFSFKNLFPSYDGKYDLVNYYIKDDIILSIFTVLICLVGLVGNGTVIWLLGFRLKRKPFATYFLNLTAADFGCLVAGFALNVFNILIHVNNYRNSFTVRKILLTLYMFMCTSSELLLAAIGIDRCVFVLFPNWYQCHQSPVLSTRLCVLVWTLTFVLDGILLIISLASSAFHPFSVVIMVYIVSTLICILLVTISALTLLIKVWFKSQWCQCKNLLKVVLLMLLSFLLFTLLPYAVHFVFPFQSLFDGTLGASLKSSINPLIYFLTGRQKGGKFQERMKVILQRVFKEERDTRMELQPRIETQL